MLSLLVLYLSAALPTNGVVLQYKPAMHYSTVGQIPVSIKFPALTNLLSTRDPNLLILSTVLDPTVPTVNDVQDAKCSQQDQEAFKESYPLIKHDFQSVMAPLSAMMEGMQQGLRMMGSSDLGYLTTMGDMANVFRANTTRLMTDALDILAKTQYSHCFIGNMVDYEADGIKAIKMDVLQACLSESLKISTTCAGCIPQFMQQSKECKAGFNSWLTCLTDTVMEVYPDVSVAMLMGPDSQASKQKIEQTLQGKLGSCMGRLKESSQCVRGKANSMLDCTNSEEAGRTQVNEMLNKFEAALDTPIQIDIHLVPPGAEGQIPQGQAVLDNF